MSSYNRATLVGNLGGDPELRATASGQAVASWSLATSERYTDKDGQRQEVTEWHRIVAWGKSAELADRYLKKGSKCLVEGRIKTRKWTDRDGVERYTTEIIADRVVFLDSAQKAEGGAAEPPRQGRKGQSMRQPHDGYSSRQSAHPPAHQGNFDDDIPF